MEVANYLRGLESPMKRAATKAVIQTTVAAERQAKLNAQAQFRSRNGRVMQGYLMNSIYSGYEQTGSEIPVGYLGVRNIPYGAIHEFGSRDLPGGVIVPKKAKKLWIPQYKYAGRMTPREFVEKMRADRGMYLLTDKVAAVWSGKYTEKPKKKIWIPLFMRVDKVTMPERPYLRPAIEQEVARYGQRFSDFLAQEI